VKLVHVQIEADLLLNEAQPEQYGAARRSPALNSIIDHTPQRTCYRVRVCQTWFYNMLTGIEQG
jgi:hypothetical protein